MTKTLLPRLCTAGLLAGLLASCESISLVSQAPLLGATWSSMANRPAAAKPAGPPR